MLLLVSQIREEVLGPWAQEAQINKCTFTCKHKKSNEERPVGNPLGLQLPLSLPFQDLGQIFLFPVN